MNSSQILALDFKVAGPTSDIFVRWISSPYEYHKLSSDGSVGEGGSSVRSGFIIENWMAKIVATGHTHWNEVSVPEAELRGLWEGVVCAVRKCEISNLTIEGDSQPMVASIVSNILNLPGKLTQ